MKKNITINLAGQLFAIDEDAYGLLLDYTETLRRYYRRQSEGEEVVDDIEARIAELFSELKDHGYAAITIEHVQTIIERIGRLEDLTGNAAPGDASDSANADAASAATQNTQSTSGENRGPKRFYRDTENKMLAGVLAGLSRYFGGDVVIWRAVFLVLVLVPIPLISSLQGVTGLLVILYIIAAIIAPAASTPEERLKMRGEDVNPQNLASEVNRVNSPGSYNETAAQRRHAITTIFAVLLIIFSVWMWLGCLGVLCGGCAVLVAPELVNDHYFCEDRNAPIDAFDTIAYSIFYILAAVEACLFVLAYCSMHTGLSLLDKVKAMSLKERIVWLAVWAASVVAIVMTSVSFAQKAKAFEHDYPFYWEELTDEQAIDEDSTAEDSTTEDYDIYDVHDAEETVKE